MEKILTANYDHSSQDSTNILSNINTIFLY